MVPLAHTSDAAGSIRIPASCCGVFGFKTSRDRNVRARAQHVLDDVLCSDGMISRSVRDAAWAFDVVRPDDTTAPAVNGPLRRLRIAVVREGLDGAAPDAEVTDAINKTASLCEQLGHRVAEARLPIDGRELVHDLLVLWGYLGNDVVASVRGEAHGRPLEELLEPFTLSLGDWGSRLRGADLERAFAQVTELPKALAQFFRDFDVVLSPVTREPPLPLGRLAPTQPFASLLQDMFGYVNYTPLQNLAGTPAMSVPLFTNAQGLPIGSMFAAARGADELLLALAFELESAQPWIDRWPALSR